jgi:hypothetical protein
MRHAMTLVTGETFSLTLGRTVKNLASHERTPLSPPLHGRRARLAGEPHARDQGAFVRRGRPHRGLRYQHHHPAVREAEPESHLVQLGRGTLDALVPRNDGGTSASDHYILLDVPGVQSFTATQLEDRNPGRPDCFWDDATTTLYALGSHHAASRFWRMHYDLGTATYTPAVDGIVVPGFTHEDENDPASVYVSPNGVVWAAVMKTGALHVQRSLDGGTTWLPAPVTLIAPTTLGVTAWNHFTNGGATRVGLFAAENAVPGSGIFPFMYFHLDEDADPTVLANWVDESTLIPAPGAASADDHVSPARDLAGNQYFGVKTQDGNPTDPLINLYRRTPQGFWSQFTITQTSETPEQSRPSLVIDDENAMLYVYTNDTNGGVANRTVASLNALGAFASAPMTPVFAVEGVEFTDVITPQHSVNASTDLVVLAHNQTERTVWYAAEDIVPPPSMVTVPDVGGLARTVAEGAIATAGLVLGGTDQVSSATVPTGHIIAQHPAGGSSAQKGSAVFLIVSSGPPPCNVKIVGAASNENRIYVAFYNDGTPGTITRMAGQWAQQNGNLRKIKVNGSTIFSCNLTPTSATLTSFSGTPASRTLGRWSAIEFEFQYKVRSGMYALHINFAQGCAVHLGPGA